MCQLRAKLIVRLAGRCSEQVEIELPADGRGNLCDFLGQSESIQAGKQG
jgi:hypothetical protein